MKNILRFFILIYVIFFHNLFISAQNNESEPNNIFSNLIGNNRNRLVFKNDTVSVKGQQSYFEDEDIFVFQSPRKCAVRVRLTPADYFATNFAIHNQPNDQSRIVDYRTTSPCCDEGGKTDDRRFLVCEANTDYYIKIRCNSGQGTSIPYEKRFYNLHLQLDTEDKYECNESFTTSTPINLNTLINATVSYPRDNDVFSFQVSRPSIITTTITNLNPNLVIGFKVFDSNQNQLNISSNLTEFYDDRTYKRYTLTCEPGKHYVNIYHARNDFGTQSYRYNFSVAIDSTDKYECNNTFSTAKFVKCGDTISGNFLDLDKDEYDIFKFDAVKDKPIKIKAISVPDGFALLGRLYDPDQINWEFGGFGTAELGGIYEKTFIPKKTGVYYVSWSAFHGLPLNINSTPYKFLIQCSSTPTLDTEDNLQLSVSPSPVESLLTVSNIKKVIQTLQITNLTGQTLFQKIVNDKQAEIDVSTLAKGLYLLSIQTTDGKKGVKKFIKQ